LNNIIIRRILRFEAPLERDATLWVIFSDTGATLKGRDSPKKTKQRLFKIRKHKNIVNFARFLR